MPDHILVAEEDLYQRAMLAGHLAEMDCNVVQCTSASQALAHVAETRVSGADLDLALVSASLSCDSGVPLFRELLHRHEDFPIVLLSDRGSVSEAGLAMREGVYDYLTKPFESLDDVGLRVLRALEKARLRRENRDFRRHIEYDLEIARSVQENFLPAEFPRPDRVEFGAHYTACSGVGGDLYDAVELDDTRVGAYIFDVAGHGASAALVTAILKIGFQAFFEGDAQASSREQPTLAAIEYLNPLLRRMTTLSQFATMLYTVLDIETERLALTSAGHCPPVIIEPDGTPRYLKPQQGIPLGVYPDAEYHQEFIDFRPGSSILLYTDGITEAADAHYEQWGSDNLLASVARQGQVGPQELIDGVLADLAEHTRGEAWKDDVTALAMRFNP